MAGNDISTPPAPAAVTQTIIADATAVVAEAKTEAVVVVSFVAKVKAFALKYGITGAGLLAGFLLGRLL